MKARKFGHITFVFFGINQTFENENRGQSEETIFNEKWSTGGPRRDIKYHTQNPLLQNKNSAHVR